LNLIGKKFWSASSPQRDAYYQIVAKNKNKETGEIAYQLRFVDVDTGEFTGDTNMWLGKDYVEDMLKSFPAITNLGLSTELIGEEYELD
jgi:hypothetical protein